MYLMNIKELVRKLGGRTALANKLEADSECKTVSRKGIGKWHERHTLPLNRLIDCMMLSKKAGEPIDVYDLIEEKGKQ